VIEQTAIGCLPLLHFGATIQAAEQRASEARRIADLATCEVWNIRMIWQPGAAIAMARRRAQTIIRRPRETPIWQLEQRMRCKPCSEQRGYP
jgi:hypothetical protein